MHWSRIMFGQLFIPTMVNVFLELPKMTDMSFDLCYVNRRQLQQFKQLEECGNCKHAFRSTFKIFGTRYQVKRVSFVLLCIMSSRDKNIVYRILNRLFFGLRCCCCPLSNYFKNVSSLHVNTMCSVRGMNFSGQLGILHNAECCSLYRAVHGIGSGSCPMAGGLWYYRCVEPSGSIIRELICSWK
jgi:hypothetical protein